MMEGQAAYSGVPITTARGKWAVDLCKCWYSPFCLLPFFSTCVPCVPLARAAARAGVGSYTAVLATVGVLTLLVSTWPSPADREVYVVELDGVDGGSLDAASASNSTVPDARGSALDDVEGWAVVEAPEVSGAWLLASQLGFFAVSAALVAVYFVIRTRLVRKYEIDEHPAASCALVLCCPCCAIAQQAMHVGARAPRRAPRAPKRGRVPLTFRGAPRLHIRPQTLSSTAACSTTARARRRTRQASA